MPISWSIPLRCPLPDLEDEVLQSPTQYSVRGKKAEGSFWEDLLLLQNLTWLSNLRERFFRCVKNWGKTSSVEMIKLRH